MSAALPILIVGQGLAGSLLGWELARRGQGIKIIDTQDPYAASPVSAGILNPVTGKRIVKTWNVDSLLPIARKTYRLLEESLAVSIFKEMPIVRLFQSAEEVRLWEERRKDPAYTDWLEARYPPGFHGPEVNDPHGSFAIRGGGWLSIGTLVRTFRQWFTERGLFEENALNYRDLDLSSDGARIDWKGSRFARVIFCEGYRSAENPWFNWLDYRLSRGEVLDADTEAKLPDCILNRGKWILPAAPGTARIGATYQWDNLEAGTTASGLAELVKASRDIHRSKFTIKDHRAGVRPGTNDSRPYVGLHPLEPRLGILNGLGSKGSLTAPAAARQLALHLLEGEPLDPEWDLPRRLKFLSEPLTLP